MSITFGVNISPGDVVQQIAPVGLGVFVTGDFLYVTHVVNGELELSKVPGGPPLRDHSGQPRLYPPCKFRKVTW